MIWIVVERDWDHHALLSVWSSPKAAEEEANKQREQNPGGMLYEVEGPYLVRK